MKIGVLGGGQLGKMLAMAGKPLGHEFVFLDPQPTPCAAAHGTHIQGAFDSTEYLDQLAEACDVLTYEFENLPLTSVEYLAKKCAVFPSPEALRVTQDRLLEKTLCAELQIPTVQFAAVQTAEDLPKAIEQLGYPCILKTNRMGYDGKGQVFLQSEEQKPQAEKMAAQQACILEACANFEREVSQISTRNKAGEIVCYPLTENIHHDGILRVSTAPAEVDDSVTESAQRTAQKILEHFDYVGTLAIEFFLMPDGSLLLNEMAPRVHNSGHWTIEGAKTSQFTNHILAITGQPLESTGVQGYAAMVNIIGTWPATETLEALPDVYIHHYEKSERPGRKIGHITTCNQNKSVVQKNTSTILDIVDQLLN